MIFLIKQMDSSQLAKSDEGKEVEKLILNVTFWKEMKYSNFTSGDFGLFWNVIEHPWHTLF